MRVNFKFKLLKNKNSDCLTIKLTMNIIVAEGIKDRSEYA